MFTASRDKYDLLRLNGWNSYELINIMARPGKVGDRDWVGNPKKGIAPLGKWMPELAPSERLLRAWQNELIKLNKVLPGHKLPEGQEIYISEFRRDVLGRIDFESTCEQIMEHPTMQEEMPARRSETLTVDEFGNEFYDEDVDSAEMVYDPSKFTIGDMGMHIPVFICYEQPGWYADMLNMHLFCHRYLVAEWLEGKLSKNGVNVTIPEWYPTKENIHPRLLKHYLKLGDPLQTIYRSRVLLPMPGTGLHASAKVEAKQMTRGQTTKSRLAEQEKILQSERAQLQSQARAARTDLEKSIANKRMEAIRLKLKEIEDDRKAEGFEGKPSPTEREAAMMMGFNNDPEGLIAANDYSQTGTDMDSFEKHERVVPAKTKLDLMRTKRRSENDGRPRVTLCIAGSRWWNPDYKKTGEAPREFDDQAIIDAVGGLVVDSLHVTEIITGDAKGADRMGNKFARKNKLYLTRVPAPWSKYGLRAGNMRNEWMAEYADYVLVFQVADLYGKARSPGSAHMAAYSEAKGKLLVMKKDGDRISIKLPKEAVKEKKPIRMNVGDQEVVAGGRVVTAGKQAPNVNIAEETPEQTKERRKKERKKKMLPRQEK